MDLPVKGDRIELLEMGAERDGRPDPCPIERGATGTVMAVVGMNWFGERSHQISVDWDPQIGRTLSLVVPPDRYRIIGKEDG